MLASASGAPVRVSSSCTALSHQAPLLLRCCCAVAAVPTFIGYQGPDRVTAFSGADKVG